MTRGYPPHWQLRLFNMAGQPLGEVLDAHDRQLSFQLLSPNTIKFRMELVNPQVSNFLTNKEGLILAYRNGLLAMTAEIGSIEVTGTDEGQHDFTVTALETMHARLFKRLLGKSSAGLNGPTTPRDQGLWLMDQLDALNQVNNTGLRDGAVTPSGSISGGTWRYKPFMELMQELSATLAGFDFYQRPRDPSGAVPGLTGVIDIKSVIGRTRSNVVLEYGTGAANARAYQWLIHNESEVNNAICLPPDFPDNAALAVKQASDATAIARVGRREEVIPTDINGDALRLAYAQFQVALRKNPREQFIIQPAQSDGSGRVPEFLSDYNVGDTIRGRVMDQGLLHLDAMVRVYGVTVSLNDEGQETVDLNLINDGAATDSGDAG